MTVKKVSAGDEDYIVCVADDDGDPVAIEAFNKEYHADYAVRLLCKVLTYAGVSIKEITDKN